MDDLIRSREAYIARAVLEESSQEILNYSPQDYQLDFHLADKYISGLFGANKIGKSLSGTWEFCAHETGIYPDWFPKHLRLNGKVRGRIIINDFGQVFKSDILPLLEKWIPKKMYSQNGGYRKKNSQGLYTDWVLSNGNAFHIMSNEQDTEQFEGAELELILVNEPCSRDNFIASTRGLVVTGGRVMMTMTLLRMAGWILTDILGSKDAYVSPYIDITQNKYLTQENIDKFADTLTEEEKEARLHGRPVQLAGRVHKLFEEGVHCINRFVIPQDWNRYLILDPHEREPFAFLWGAISPQNRIYWYDNVSPLSGTGVKDLSAIIKAKEGNDRIYKRIMDCHYMTKPQISDNKNRNLSDMFSDHKIYFEPSNPDFTTGRLAVDEYLAYDKQKPIDDTNSPGMFWFKDLLEPKQSMQYYSWDDWVGRSKDAKELKPKPKSKFSHYADDVRYLCIEKPKYIPPGLKITTKFEKIKRSYI